MSLADPPLRLGASTQKARPRLPFAQSSRTRLFLAILVGMAAIFAIDTLSPEPLAVAVLYVCVILGAAAARRRTWIISTATVSIALAFLSFLTTHGFDVEGGHAVRFAISIAAIAMATYLTIRNVTASQLLRDQATLLDQTHDSVTVRTLDGTLTYWNQGAADLYGWTSEEACGQRACEMLRIGTAVPPMSIEDFIAAGSWNGEVEPFAKDGRQLVVQLRCSLLFDDRGRVAGVLSTGNDITQRKRADTELRRSEARYRNIFQTSSVSIWECDFSAVKTRIAELAAAGMTDFRRYLNDNPGFVREAINLTRAIAVNDASVAMFGASTKEDLIGSVGHIWPPEGEITFAEAMIAAVEGRASYETEARLRKLDGRPLDLFFTTSFPPEAASRESVFISVADITAHNEARTALQAAQTDLAHATRLTSLGQLTASIAHEVNQPLGGIISNGQAGLRWLKRHEPNVEAAIQSFEGLIEEARRAGEVIRRFRSLAKNDAPIIESVDFNALVEETILLLGHELRRGRVEVVSHLEKNLTPVRGDRIQLQQVVINLVMNAVQAMANVGDEERELTISTSTAQDVAVVAVSDTGPGIAEELKDRLFTAFATTKPDGMGLGLSVCGSIIRRHGGKIWVEEREGRGARFEFSVPFGEHEGHI